MIEVNHLNKEFTYYKKEVGLKNSFKNLIHKEKLVKKAVNDISFHIDEGEVVGFLGPNGAGKTTTLKMLSGILYPTSGDVRVMGYVPWERKKEFKMNFSIVMGQKNQLWWDLPACESLYLNKCIYELDDKSFNHTLNELIEMLDVRDQMDIQVRRLSLGERMKLELIAALIHKPKVIFLDEPTIGLDIISQKKIREFLKYYNAQTKTTIILTSHYMNDIEEMCKRSIIINEGTVVYDDELSKVNELFNKTKLIKLKLSQPVETGKLELFGEVKEYEDLNAVIAVPKDDVKECSKVLLDRLPVTDFTIEDIPIEEGISLIYQKGGAVHEHSEEVC